MIRKVLICMVIATALMIGLQSIEASFDDCETDTFGGWSCWTRIPKPASTPTATPVPTATPSPIVAATMPDLSHNEAKLFVLRAINELREDAGVSPVLLGTNDAAQLHADSLLSNCIYGHFGLDGLNPLLRYNLAGGFAYSSEVATASNAHCVGSPYQRLVVQDSLGTLVESLAKSQGHLDAMIDGIYNTVNIGIAWDEYNMRLVAQFEARYLRYKAEPSLDEDGQLSFTASLPEGFSFELVGFSNVTVFFHSPISHVTRGQVERTYCFVPPPVVAVVLSPGNYRGVPLEFHVDRTANHQCRPPSYFEPGEGSSSIEEAHEAWCYAKREAGFTLMPWDNCEIFPHPVPATSLPQNRDGMFLVASSYGRFLRGKELDISVSLAPLFSEYGDGVYTVRLWGKSEKTGENTVLSDYSLWVPPRD